MSGQPVVVAVQASIGATPHHGAVLADVAGEPALGLVLRRLEPLRALTGAELAVVTTDAAADDAIAAIAAERDVRAVRGPIGDPLQGLAIAMVRLGAETMVLVGADGPFADPYVVQAALALHAGAGADHTSNLLPRSYPRGLDVEVVSKRALGACEIEITDPVERRSPGAHLRRHPQRFRLANLLSGHGLAGERWVIDSTADLQRVREVAGQVPDLHTASWNRILSVAGRAAKPRPGELRLEPEPASEPGAYPWTCRWAVVVDGDRKGTATATTADGQVRHEVDVPEAWREPARAALYRLLHGDTDPRS